MDSIDDCPTPPDVRAALIATFNRSRECTELPMLTPAEPRLPYCLERLTEVKAEHVAERCNYVITGLVMRHRTLPKRAIVESTVRWFPNEPEFMLMMMGRKASIGPGEPPSDAIGDEVLCPAVEPASAPPTALAIPAATPTRPVLTAPPSAQLLESTEEALGMLANELGCVRNDEIPHNAGWFVPGKPTAYASALDAIKGLFASLSAGGTVFARKPVDVAAQVNVTLQKKKAEPEPVREVAQDTLF